METKRKIKYLASAFALAILNGFAANPTVVSGLADLDVSSGEVRTGLVMILIGGLIRFFEKPRVENSIKNKN